MYWYCVCVGPLRLRFVVFALLVSGDNTSPTYHDYAVAFSGNAEQELCMDDKTAGVTSAGN